MGGGGGHGVEEYVLEEMDDFHKFGTKEHFKDAAAAGLCEEGCTERGSCIFRFRTVELFVRGCS